MPLRRERSRSRTMRPRLPDAPFVRVPCSGLVRSMTSPMRLSALWARDSSPAKCWWLTVARRFRPKSRLVLERHRRGEADISRLISADPHPNCRFGVVGKVNVSSEVTLDAQPNPICILIECFPAQGTKSLAGQRLKNRSAANLFGEPRGFVRRRGFSAALPARQARTPPARLQSSPGTGDAPFAIHLRFVQ